MITFWRFEHGSEELVTDAERTSIGAQYFNEKIGYSEVDVVVKYRLELKDN